MSAYKRSPLGCLELFHTDSYLWIGVSGNPTAGSFIRPFRASDRALSFLNALKKKYSSNEGDQAPGVGKEIHISGKTVEEVGFDEKKRQLAVLENLKVAILDGLCITGIESTLHEDDGPLVEYQSDSTTQRISPQDLTISELDLSRNLLETWLDVIDICQPLKCLHSLKIEYVRRTIAKTML